MTEVPFARLRGFGQLFTDYCQGPDTLASFFGGDWRSAGHIRQVAHQAGPPIAEPLARALLRQNDRWSNPVGPLVRALEARGALAVVTGQQLGIFGGPLYSLYKALTAVKLARHLSETLQRPVVPVFWLEGGDHDLPEVSQLHVPGHAALQSLQYRGHVDVGHVNAGSVGALAFEPDIDRIREALRSSLPNTGFRDRMLEDYFGGYRPGVRFVDAFARTMVALLGGRSMVFVDPEALAVKRLAAPLFERALLGHAELHAALTAATDSVRQRYPAQVRPRATTLFYQDVRGRTLVEPDGNGFGIWRGAKRASAAVWVARLQEDPSRFTPNVVLRPVLQDTLFPTVAYVAGPGEVSYFAQLRPVYEWAKVTMPVIYPRASLTVVEPRVGRILDRTDLGMTDLQESLEGILERLLMHSSGVDAAFARAEGGLSALATALLPVVEAVDPTLGRTCNATRASWTKDLHKLRRRVVKAEKRKHDVLRARLSRARQALFPGGKLQERVLGAVYLACRFGPEVVDAVYERISLDTASHQLLAL